MDGQMDRILLAIPRLHYMQRGKNQSFGFIPKFKTEVKDSDSVWNQSFFV